MPVLQSMMDMAGFGRLHISAQGVDKWERYQEGVERNHERRPLATRWMGRSDHNDVQGQRLDWSPAGSGFQPIASCEGGLGL